MIDDDSVDACAFVGYHAPAGTADGLLAHSFSGAALPKQTLNLTKRSQALRMNRRGDGPEQIAAKHP